MSKARISGLGAADRRTEILRAREVTDTFAVSDAAVAALDVRVDAVEALLAARYVDYVEITSDTATTTTTGADAGLSLTWTGKAGYVYLAYAEASLGSTVATDSYSLAITTSGGSNQTIRYMYAGAANRQGTIGCTNLVFPVADGSLTRKVQYGRVTGSGNVKIYATSPAFLYVVELGAA